MGFDLNLPEADYRVKAAGLDNIATAITPEHWYSGMFGAAGKGVVGGMASVTRAARDFGAAALDFGDVYGVGTNFYEQAQGPNEFNKKLKEIEEWAKLDPRVYGFGAQVAGSTTRGLSIMFLGSLAGGPLGGAALLGGTEGYTDYLDSTAAGVDSNTALAKAALTGTVAFGGAFLPMKVSGKAALGVAALGLEAEVAGNQALANVLYKSAGAAAKMTGLTGRLASGVAINTGFGMANRYATSHLLESAGYTEMAKQYEVLDAKAVAADVVLGLAFGGWGHMEERLHATQRPSRDMVDAALDARRQEMIARGGPGLPTEPGAALLDSQLQDRAVSVMVREQPLEIRPEEATRMVEGVVLDPQRMELHQDWLNAWREAYGPTMDFSEPQRLPEAPPAPIEPKAPKAPVAPAEAEPTAKMSPLMKEQMDQIALRHPDMDVTLPDGRTIKASEMPDVLAEQLQMASKESNLIEAAVGCFLRTTL